MDERLFFKGARAQDVGTFAVVTKVAQLKLQGRKVVDFGAGRPDFDTPDHIKEAAIKALRSGDTKYTSTLGKPELRAAVANWMNGKGCKFDQENVIISVGGKHALYNSFASILDLEDEVIIPAPYYVSITEIVRLCGGNQECSRAICGMDSRTYQSTIEVSH